jgi:hypothetical protein
MTGVSIPGEECRKSGGVTSSAPSSLNYEYWKNNVITEAYCSSSRVTVAIIPQTGERSRSFMTVCFTRENRSLFQASLVDTTPGYYSLCQQTVQNPLVSGHR